MCVILHTHIYATWSQIIAFQKVSTSWNLISPQVSMELSTNYEMHFTYLSALTSRMYRGQLMDCTTLMYL
jgi:hypothetical protein